MGACGCKTKACGCKHKHGENTMDRAESIAALVTDKHSGFRDGDESLLEAASDARLEEFRNTSDSRRLAALAAAKLESDHRNVSARLKIAEERVKDSEKPLTKEDFMARAPEDIKAILEERAAEEAAVKASLVSQLKDLGEHTEEDLKKMDIGALKTLASYARVEVAVYSARGLPKERDTEHRRNYTPPDPYAAGLKALRQGK